MTALLAFLLFGGSLADTLTAYTRCYAEAMNLQNWEIEISFERVDEDGSEAGTFADPQYFMAEISYDTTAFERRDDEYLRWVVVHELFHVWIWQLAEIAQNPELSGGTEQTTYALLLEERLGSQFARFFAPVTCKP